MRRMLVVGFAGRILIDGRTGTENYLTPDLIANEALYLLQNKLVGIQTFSKSHQAVFNGENKVGDRVKVRRRRAGTVTEAAPYDSLSLTFQSPKETNIEVVLEKHFIIPIEVSSSDMTLSLENFSSQVLAPQIVAIGESADNYALTKFKEVPTVGGLSSSAPAALPSSAGDLAGIERTLFDQKVPGDGLLHVCSGELAEGLVASGTISSAEQRGDGGTALENAQIGRVMNLNHVRGQGIDSATFTRGTMVSAVLNGAHTAGATTITYDGADGASVTLKKYDIVTIGTKACVVAADATASSNAGTFTIFDPLPDDIADNAAITVYDSASGTRQLHGCAFHPDAFTFVSVPGEMPLGGATGQVVTDGNMSMRVLFGFSMGGLSNQMVLDFVAGAKLVDPRLATQVVKNI